MCVREIGLDFRGYGFIGEGCELRGKVGEEGSGKVMMENSARRGSWVKVLERDGGVWKKPVYAVESGGSEGDMLRVWWG